MIRRNTPGILKIVKPMFLVMMTAFCIRKYQFYVHSPNNPIVAVRDFFYERESAESILLPNPNLIEICGQSNAVGMAEMHELPTDLKSIDKGEWIFDCQHDIFEPLKPGVNNSGYPDNSFNNHFGIEVRLMNLLHRKYDQNQYLIKFSIGSTQLQWNNIEMDWSTKSVNEYFDQSNERHFDALKALNDSRPPLAFIWIQGENDTFADKAVEYCDNLKQFISEKRRSYGYPNMPFIIVRLGNTQTLLNRKYVKLIRKAQEEVVAEPNNYLVDADNLPVIGQVHYTGASFDVLANEVFQIVKRLKEAASMDTRLVAKN